MTRFLKVQCQGCKNEQIIFSRAANVCNCLICGEVLATPTGGKSVVTAKIVELV
ncbi:MAG: 30S ribosomal protein S27e [Candidatus Woesearchaeota archaeon]